MSADDVSPDSDRSVAEHDVSVRVPMSFSCNGYTIPLTQLALAAHLFHGLIRELEAFFRDCPEDLETSVDGAPYLPVDASVTGPQVSPQLRWFVDALCAGTLTVAELVAVLTHNPQPPPGGSGRCGAGT